MYMQINHNILICLCEKYTEQSENSIKEPDFTETLDLKYD